MRPKPLISLLVLLLAALLAAPLLLGWFAAHAV